MNEELLYQLALSRIKGIGPTVAKSLISYCGSAQEVFSTSTAQLGKIPGVGSKLLNLLKSAPSALPEAEMILKSAQQHQAQILTYTDKAYPYRLKQIADAPNVLYFKGQGSLNARHCLAIVGTRKASQYGKDLVNDFISSWAPYQPLIVSGLAYGIDIHAHRAALKLGLPTLGVMASGLDIIYPPTHQQWARQMQEQGGLLSEHPFGTKPDAFYFPARNRIIAGLSPATVVFEAGSKGGALITARLARDYDREVYALPGSLHNEASAGCHQLIREQTAQLLSTPDQLPEELGWQLQPRVSDTEAPDFSSLSAEQRKIAEVLYTQPAGMHIDMLVYKCGLSFSTLASYLLELEFSGWVRTLPGKKYQLLRK